MQTHTPFVPAVALRPVTLENPGPAENVWIGFAFRDLQLDQIVAVVRGAAPSVTWNVRFGALRDEGAPSAVLAVDQETTDTGAGDVLNAFENAVIPAGSHIWVTTSAVGGVVDELSIALQTRGLL